LVRQLAQNQPGWQAKSRQLHCGQYLEMLVLGGTIPCEDQQYVAVSWWKEQWSCQT
jgi:hypothetical protein